MDWRMVAMPWIRFLKPLASPRPAVEVPSGSNLMKALLEAGLPVASSCRGDGVCSKCRIEIVDGEKNLSVQNSTEKGLRVKNSLADNERISCQTAVLGDVTVNAAYW
jgi:2Fe-2S ferredoxin